MGAVFGFGGALLLPVLLLTGAPILASWHNFAAVAYLALVPMFAGYALFGRGLAAIPASTATSLSLLEPAVAAIIAVLVLHERLPVLGWVGMGVLLASLLALTAPVGWRRPEAASTSSPIPSRAGEPATQ
jgi:DME family drug/metabolite transporter